MIKNTQFMFLTMLFIYYSLYSSEGSTVIPLNGSCNSSLFQDIAATPPSFTSTSLSNTTSINTTVTAVPTSVNVTASPANVTTSGNVGYVLYVCICIYTQSKYRTLSKTFFLFNIISWRKGNCHIIVMTNKQIKCFSRITVMTKLTGL